MVTTKQINLFVNYIIIFTIYRFLINNNTNHKIILKKSAMEQLQFFFYVKNMFSLQWIITVLKIKQYSS